MTIFHKIGHPMLVMLKVKRFDPERNPSIWWSTFTLEAEPADRILDLLIRAKDEHDGSLTFRRSCGHGICGSCAVRVNGSNRLACKTLIRELGSRITLEPLLGLRVEKDLVVDMDPFFAAFRSVKPYLINGEPLPGDGRERRQTPAERMRFDDSTKCILCAACTTACPVFWADDTYIGPAAIVAAHRFLFDSRGCGGDLALPDGFPMHHRLPARDQGHPGYRRGQRGDSPRNNPIKTPRGRRISLRIFGISMRRTSPSRLNGLAGKPMACGNCLCSTINPLSLLLAPAGTIPPPADRNAYRFRL
jgi:succinate dehydrogenase / fumarate reductase iron-sulfur subunit